MTCCRTILLVLLAAVAAMLAPGCADEAPEGSIAEWLDDARALESQGQFFRDDRENAPPGALEFYQLCLASDDLPEDVRREVRYKVDWFSALRLMLTGGSLGKPDYPAAIAAMTEFRKAWPDSADAPLALFYRGLAREYDVDFQNTAGAAADYTSFAEQYPDHRLVPEAMFRIGHAREFDLDSPDRQAAIEAYDALITRFGPTNEALRDAPTLTRMAVERALYHKALLLEMHLAQTDDAAGRRSAFERAAACYRRLADPLFFGQVRFKQAQFVHWRLGCILADRLGRTDEGLDVLRDMADRWRESPWRGRVEWKIDQITRADRTGE